MNCDLDDEMFTTTSKWANRRRVVLTTLGIAHLAAGHRVADEILSPQTENIGESTAYGDA